MERSRTLRQERAAAAAVLDGGLRIDVADLPTPEDLALPEGSSDTLLPRGCPWRSARTALEGRASVSCPLQW